MTSSLRSTSVQRGNDKLGGSRNESGNTFDISSVPVGLWDDAVDSGSLGDPDGDIDVENYHASMVA